MNIKYALTLPREQTEIWCIYEYTEAKICLLLPQVQSEPSLIKLLAQVSESSRVFWPWLWGTCQDQDGRRTKPCWSPCCGSLAQSLCAVQNQCITKLYFCSDRSIILGSHYKLAFLVSQVNGSWQWGPWYCKTYVVYDICLRNIFPVITKLI